MEGKLKLATYNCQGVKSSEPYIREVLEQVHIMALQETWLYPDEVGRLDGLHQDYASYSISAVDETQELRRGRPYGGVSFLWRKSLSRYIRVSSAQDNRVMSIAYDDGQFSMLLVNVYLPTSSVENRHDQLMYLGRLASLIEDAQERNICILGDFNAAPGTEFFTDVQRMCDDHGMVMADVRALPPTSFTHVNQGCLSHSWLDHVVVSPCLDAVKEECTILYDSVSSDHFPLLVGFATDRLPVLAPVRPDNV